MSLLMTNQESLEITSLEEVFEEVEPIEGAEVTRIVIGQVDEAKWARIRRVSSLILNQETNYPDYYVDLAVPYDPERKPGLVAVYSSTWKVSPRAANEPVVVAEYKADEVAAFYSQIKRKPFDNPEDLFDWYDNEERKIQAAKTPDISPNIYTVPGMHELVKITEFREVKADDKD